MSVLGEEAFKQAFPEIQDDDPFAGFTSNSLNMASGDPFASAAAASDPFSAFDVSVTSKATANPFMSENFDEGPAVSGLTSRAETPIDESQSLRSDEVPWPGNNTTEATAETSRDSAAMSNCSDAAISQDHGCTRRDANETSASSGSEAPNIALDSDSGNLTVDTNENGCLSNTLYALMNSVEDEPGTQPALEQIQVPKITLTEATVISEKSSAVEVTGSPTPSGDSHSRLLDSSELDISGDRSQSNKEAELSSLNCSAEVVPEVDNLSTMNISLFNSTGDGSDSIVDPQNTGSSPAPNFFTQSEVGHGEDQGEQSVVKSELTDESMRELAEGDTLAMPKADRVLTSSPINTRTISPEVNGGHVGPLTSWARSNRETIRSKDEKEKKDIEELKEQAKSDLDQWYRERQAKIEAQHTLHLEHQDVQYAERPKTDERTVWQGMASLALELNQGHKIDDKRRDTSKMKHLLQLLAVKAPSLKQ